LLIGRRAWLGRRSAGQDQPDDESRQPFGHAAPPFRGNAARAKGAGAAHLPDRSTRLSICPIVRLLEIARALLQLAFDLLGGAFDLLRLVAGHLAKLALHLARDVLGEMTG